MPRKPIVPSDLYQVRMPGEIRFSPAARRFAVTVARIDETTYKTHSQIWVGESDPGDDSANLATARAFTQGKQRDRHPRWSPDGSKLAFLSDRSEKTEIWIMESSGGEARQLTELKGSVQSFEWHPNGRRMVAVFREADPETEARKKAKKLEEPGSDQIKVRATDRLVYKIDGSGFLPPTRAHVWTIDAETGRGRALLRDDRYDESSARFTPDGRGITFESVRTDDPDLDCFSGDLWRMPARGGDPEKIKTFAGPAHDHAVSPDGEWIAFLGKPNATGSWNRHHVKLYRIPLAGGRPVELSETLDRACDDSTIGDMFADGIPSAPTWSPDSEWIYFKVTNEGNTELWRVHRLDRKPEPVVYDPGVVLDYALDFDAGRIHYSWADPTNPGEVRTRPLPTPLRRVRVPAGTPGMRRAGSGVSPGEEEVRRPPANVRVRTELNGGWLAHRKMNVPEEVWFEGKGGHALQGWILRPPGFDRRRKYPGLLYIHGGPATQYGRTFFHEFQYLAGRGYVVFYCNPRGGTGYSERHLSAIVGRWGTTDYDDLMRFTDTVLRRHRYIDRKRVGVAGGSYGGFMTNWIIGHTQRFACAITQRCLSNLLSFVGASDFGFQWPREFGGGTPWENPRHYLKMSPLAYLKNMKTPTLIEHQEEDHRCPIDQAEQLWSALRSKGVPTEFVRYPGEPHGMSRGGRPDRRIDRLERIDAWLERWLRA